MSKWTDDELRALRTTKDYHSFGAKTGYSKSFDAWEVKRRRVDLNDPELEQDTKRLLDDLSEQQAKKSRDWVPGTPELGMKRQTPPVVAFEPVFFDIEATDLKGNFGRLLCVSGADMFGNVMTMRADDPQFAGNKRRDDSRLAVAVRDWLETFDMWVGWNSKMYDIPFIDTRLLIAGERPIRKDIMHVDPMWKAGQFSLTLHSRRLDAVAKTFRLDSQKTALDPDIWMDAAEGDKTAMDYVVEHCEADVLVLRGAFHVLKPLIKNLHR